MQKHEIPPNTLPLYQQVKGIIVGKIKSGELQPGMRIESETELVASLSVSRMTINRALRELAAEGRINRVQGRGSFVADPKPRAALLEIQSIAEEIRGRGGSYSCTIHLLQEEKANPSVAKAMQLKPYSPVFHSIIVHKDNNVPIQLGCRYVNPELAPNFLEQDFSKITVSEYLLGLTSATEIEHTVEALIPEPWIRDLLEINGSEPCLALHRKTWVGEKVATSSIFYSPGSRYSLGGKFTPASPGSLGAG